MSELANSPLQIVVYENPARRNSKGAPLMMEFPVNSELSPFLVSSSKATLWVKGRSGKVRAAVRDVAALEDYFQEVIVSLIEEGRDREWGSVHPLTPEGIKKAIGHVQSYGLEDVEILVNPKVAWDQIDPEWGVEEGDIPLVLFGVNIQPAPWLSTDTMVVIPKDRGYVGFILLFEEKIASVVHNGPRGVGIATSIFTEG